MHTAGALCFGNALLVHHPATELVPTKGSQAAPDLRMAVTADSSLAVEVKAPTNVGSRSQAMTPLEARVGVAKALKEALKQLAGGPGMLVIGGCNIDIATFEALCDAAGDKVERDGSDSNLMAIVIANLLVAVGDHALGLSGTEIGFGLKTRIRSNQLYAGPIEFVGDWSGKWQLLPKRASSRKTIYVSRRRLM